MPDTKEERKSIFDIYCESKTGERFIVEMQKAKKGEWDFLFAPRVFHRHFGF